MFRLFFLSMVLLAGCAQTTEIARRDFFLPGGDSMAGRQAFTELKCTSCHRVHGVDDLPPPVTNQAVLVLAGPSRSRATDGRIVTAIIHPNQRISWPLDDGARAIDGSSRMGDFSSVMTVRQLIDIVAFLRAQQTHE